MSVHGFMHVKLAHQINRKKRKFDESDDDSLADDCDDCDDDDDDSAPLFSFLRNYRDVAETNIFKRMNSTALRLFSRANKETKLIIEQYLQFEQQKGRGRITTARLLARDIESINMLAYALEKNELVATHRLVAFYASLGRLSLVKYLIEETFELTWSKADKKQAYGLISAAQWNHFDVVKYLHEEAGCYMSERVSLEACVNGNLR